MNCSWASDPSYSAISSGVNGLYVDLWSTYPLCVRIFVVIAGPTTMALDNSLISAHHLGMEQFHLKT